MHDLLNDPIIGVRIAKGSEYVSLPELFGLLCEGGMDGYTGLRAHQADPWHVFLVQIAASVLARRPQPALPCDPAFWREGLLDLAEGQRSAWNLVEEDVTKPAFLQHPWTSWGADSAAFGATPKKGKWLFEPKARTPDALDVLVTAKNHDVKARRIAPNASEAWLYALLLYQTTSGFLGNGNYGVVRMNGGFASRAIAAWVTSLNPSRRFLEELSIVQGLRAEVVRQHRYQERGTVLTWLERWDRATHQCSLQNLEPWFIEACRPVRLRVYPDGTWMALGATSRARQIGPKSVDSGDVGDLWTPINTGDKKKGRSALTLPASGFTPEAVTNLLFEQGFELSDLQRPRPGSEPGWFVASVLVRGQGTTEGFHRLELPVPAKVRMTLAKPDGRQHLARVAQKLLGDAKGTATALRFALTVLVEGGPDKVDFDRDAVKRWVRAAMARLDQHWEETYFPTLWRAVDEADDVVQRAWQGQLVRTAESLLDEAVSRLPGLAARRWRSRTEARSALFRMLKKKNLLPDRRSSEEEAA